MNYKLIDDLTRLAGDTARWTELFGNKTLLEVLSEQTGKSATVIQKGEVGSVMSGVHGRASNRVRMAQARNTTGIEKQPKRKAVIAIIRRKNGDVQVKRNIGGKWCNTTKTVLM